MRYPLLILVAAAWSFSGPAFCDDDSGDFPPPILQDPSLATSVYISPTVTTAGVATLEAPGGLRTRALACSKTNPCALATPAASSVVLAR